MKPLTKRQKEFLRGLIDLHGKAKEAIHYPLLAERLGVAKVTAYEMLRRLEQRGLAEAAYHRPDGVQGPGRASVVFVPTADGIDSLLGAREDDPAPGEWELARSRILEKLHDAKKAGYEALLEDLVFRLQPHQSPLVYLTEMATAIVLGLHTLREDLETRTLRSLLSSIGLPGEGGLSALGGLGAGLSMVERLNKRIAHAFQAQISKYQALLGDLSRANRRRLVDFTQELVDVVAGDSQVAAERNE